MNSPPILALTEMEIVRSIHTCTPFALISDSSKNSRSVLVGQKLAISLVHQKSIAQVIFQKGIWVTARFNHSISSQRNLENGSHSFAVPIMVQKEIEVLPQIDYRRASVSLRGSGKTPCKQEEKTPHRCISKHLLCSSIWWEIGHRKIQAVLRLIYLLKEALLYLEVNVAGLQYLKKQILIFLLFPVNFIRACRSDNPEHCLMSVEKIQFLKG